MREEMREEKGHQLSKSEVIGVIPLACSDEDVAVEFFEWRRWGSTPRCAHCGSENVRKMMDSKNIKRNKRYLWRCHGCKRQFTVRIGAVYEESRLPMRYWAYAFWRAATSKKGVAALEIMRHCQITYKSALFLMNRIRFAMAPSADEPKLTGIVEADETYVGGKVTGKGVYYAKHHKTPVFAAVERDGRKRSRVVTDVTSRTLQQALKEEVDQQARIITDDYPAYRGLDARFEGGHDTVCHSTREYVRGDVHTNTVESSFALIKRGIHGIFHNVSREYLHRYLWQFDYLWNNRTLNDGERTALAIQSAEGKRMRYKMPA